MFQRVHSITLIGFALLLPLCLNAQNVQESIERQRVQKENELREQVRINKAQLGLADFYRVIGDKDLESIDRYMVGKGWKLFSTDIYGKKKPDVELASEYDQVTWRFDYGNTSNTLIHYSFSNQDNAIDFVTDSYDNFNRIQRSVSNNGFKKIDQTNVTDNGLISIYRNGRYEIRLSKKNKNRQPATTYYSIFLYDFQQIESRKSESAKKVKAAIDKENKFNSLAHLADSNCAQGQYSKAKELYKEAMTVFPEQGSRTLCVDYKLFESQEYESIYKRIETELENTLFSSKKSIPQTSAKIVCRTDTNGISSVNYDISTQDSELTELLDTIKNHIKFKKLLLNGHPVSSKAELNYVFERRKETIKVSRTCDGIASDNDNFKLFEPIIDSTLADSPQGQYIFESNSTIVNGQNTISAKLLEMSKTPGASNAWLSLLVPGLGDRFVSFGKRKGILTSISTYALLGGSIGLKLLSNDEYDKYHSATKQTDMDKYFKNATSANKAAYACAIAGSILWISDIIYVWHTGSKNTRASEKFKDSHIYGFYQPSLKAAGLTFTMNF